MHCQGTLEMDWEGVKNFFKDMFRKEREEKSYRYVWTATNIKMFESE